VESGNTDWIGDRGIGYILDAMEKDLLSCSAEGQREDRRRILNGQLNYGKNTRGEKPIKKRNRFKDQEVCMALTRDFRETVKKRVEYDPDFAKALLHESVNLMLDGDSATAKLILRDLINATVGFERLAEEVHKPSKSLHRMLSSSGNPTMENLSAIFASIKKMLHVKIDATVTAA